MLLPIPYHECYAGPSADAYFVDIVVVCVPLFVMYI